MQQHLLSDDAFPGDLIQSIPDQVPPYISSCSKSRLTRIYVTIRMKRTLQLVFHPEFNFKIALAAAHSDR